MNEEYTKRIKCCFKGGLFGLIVMLILYTAAAVILTFRDLNDGTLNLLSLVVCGAGGFCAAAKAGKENKKDGIKIGVIIGLGIFAAITIVGLARGGSFSLLTLLRLVTVIICSVAGSVFGVNRAGKRRMK